MKNKNNSLINKVLKNGKFIAIPLSIIMIANGLSACSSEKEEGEVVSKTSISQEAEEEPAIVRIGKREYRINSEGVKYTVVSGDNLWSIARDFNLEEEDLIKANNKESDLIYPDDEIIIPMSLFKEDGKLTGIEISSEEGNVNWELTSKLTDFVLIDVAQFDDDRKKFDDYLYSIGGIENLVNSDYFYDLEKEYENYETTPIDVNFVQNIEESEEYGVLQGVVVHGDLEKEELNDAKKIGEEDAKIVIDAISSYSIEYPVILDITRSGIYSSAMSYAAGFEDDYYAKRFDKPVSELCEDYCLSFMETIKKAGYYPMFCSSKEVYDNFKKKNKDIKDYSRIVYAHDYDETGRGYYYDSEHCEISMKMNESVPGLAWKNRSCPRYVDNTKDGMDKIVAKNTNQNKNNNSNRKQKSETKNNARNKVFTIGGIALGVGALAYVDKKRRDLGISLAKTLKERKNKKK